MRLNAVLFCLHAKIRYFFFSVEISLKIKNKHFRSHFLNLPLRNFSRTEKSLSSLTLFFFYPLNIDLVNHQRKHQLMM